MKYFYLSLLVIVLGAVDLYFYQAIKRITKESSMARLIANILHWGVAGVAFLMIVALVLYPLGLPLGRSLIRVFANFLIATYISKLVGVIFILLDDIIRGFRFLFSKKRKIGNEENDLKNANAKRDASEVMAKEGLHKGAEEKVEEIKTYEGKKITRSEFISKASLVAAAIPVSAYSFGILSGAHDYRVRKKQVFLPNLPKEFDGIQIAQLSDIHTGSFFNKKAVKGGVDLLLAQKPDVVFFTGDLVNEETKEANEYVDIFSKVKAPLGVYSTLGNHDYGDYRTWASEQAKTQNMEDMYKVHKNMGWDLLRDENRQLTVDGERISIIGVENWGTGRFPKYGKLAEAMKGTEEAPVKLLLSHDPSHWDAQVRPESNIDIQFAGHTHGFQFGVEFGGFRWSPAQYRYKQWADLYSEENQHLYVNRGFGYLGYPGRIGMLPEITLLELKKG